MIQELDENGYQKSPLTYEEMSNPKYSLGSQNRRAALLGNNNGSGGKGIKKSEEHKAALSAGQKGKHFASEETKAKMSASRMGMKKSEETRARISASNLGVKRSEETRARIRAGKLGKPMKIKTCPHCNKSGGNGAMTRYHFDNCKMKINK